MKVVLACSGGLTSTVAVAWLAGRRAAEVAAVIVDLGQGDDLAGARERVLAAGASRCHVLDAREAFARDFILASVRANALFDQRFPLATALGRPLIARKLAEVARIEGAATVAHGCTGADAARIGRPLRAVEPSLTELACVEAWGLTPDQVAQYASHLGLPAPDPSRDRIDRNLWGRTVGRRADPASDAVPEAVYALTRPLDRCPAHPAEIDITFEAGTPTRLNGIAMPPVELIESLTTIAGEHGCGRLERVKRRDHAAPSRVVYEAPAAVALHLAHDELERTVSSGPLAQFSRLVSGAYADVIDRGEWYDPIRAALDASVDAVQPRVTGVVRLRLFKGDCRVIGRTADGPTPHSQL